MVQRSLSDMHAIETARLVIANAEPLVPALGASASWLDPQDKYFGTEPQLIHVNGELTGRFPVWLSKWRYGLPLRVLLSWQTPLTFAGTPYLREDHVDETLAAFLTQDGPSAFLFNAIPVTGPFWDNLVRIADQLDAPIQLVNEWQRAALQPSGSFNDWFENNFERKRRKEYRRLQGAAGRNRQARMPAADAAGQCQWLA